MRFLIILLLITFNLTLFGQEAKLAQQYMVNGEYEKAVSLYQKLLDQQESNEYYFNQYIACLIALQDFDNSEKAIKKQLKKYPREVSLYVTYGNLLEKQNKPEAANEQYDKAIEELPR